MSIHYVVLALFCITYENGHGFEGCGKRKGVPGCKVCLISVRMIWAGHINCTGAMGKYM